jgi:hypothetical protein
MRLDLPRLTNESIIGVRIKIKKIIYLGSQNDLVIRWVPVVELAGTYRKCICDSGTGKEVELGWRHCRADGRALVFCFRTCDTPPQLLRVLCVLALQDKHWSCKSSKEARKQEITRV